MVEGPERACAVPLTDIDTEHAGDLLRFEAMTVGQTVADQPGYAVTVVREVLRDDQDPVYVICAFAYPLVEGAPHVQIWGEPGVAAEAWVQEVQTSPAFPLLATPPLAAVIDAQSVRGDL